MPLHACEHFYVVTEPLDLATPRLPVLRDTDGYIYLKEDAGKILLEHSNRTPNRFRLNGYRPILNSLSCRRTGIISRCPMARLLKSCRPWESRGLASL